MDKWLKDIRIKKNKKAMPVLTFPAIQLMDISVATLINDSTLQAKAMKSIVDRCDPLASLGLMDLSVEAECFGSTVRFSDDEVPTVIGSIIASNEEAEALKVPQVGDKRSGIYIEAIKQAKQMILDRPVFAGCIGPFSLAGRLLDVSEAMIYCYDDPDMVHIVLDKVTQFLIEYIKAYKAVGADGVVMAEPLAGILSPTLVDEFSSQYVKKIVDELQDDHFIIIYHNCGNNTLKMVDSLLSIGCRVYHFGNAISMKEMLEKMPSDIMVMGNVDPVHIKDSHQEDVIKETQDLLNELGDKENYVISSGCDIPPLSSWGNIDSFMQISKDFYQK